MEKCVFIFLAIAVLLAVLNRFFGDDNYSDGYDGKEPRPYRDEHEHEQHGGGQNYE